MHHLSTSLVKQIKNTSIVVSSDKSISHRAVILSSLAKGTSTITNLLNSLDVKQTIETFKALSVRFTWLSRNVLEVDSCGFGNYIVANNLIKLDMGNSGTSTRLLMAILSSNLLANNTKDTIFYINGDESLTKRPMLRVVEPLRQMGANIDFLSTSSSLPVAIKPTLLKGINYNNVSSAQVKSCLILAGIFANGQTNIGLSSISRDHTENMLENLGLNIVNSRNIIKVKGNNNLQLPKYDYVIPGDFSSASFFIALALITPQSNITIKNVNINNTRIGLLKVLKLMGANIELTEKHKLQGEPVANINVKYSNLVGCVVDGDLVNSMIDEYPILAVIALFAKGKTVFNNVLELRYKESDRIQSIVDNFNTMGFTTNSTHNSLTIYGLTNIVDNVIINKTTQLNSFLDHRIAMAMLVLSSRCKNKVTVLNCKNINTSFPNFLDIAQDLNWIINKA